MKRKLFNLLYRQKRIVYSIIRKEERARE